MLSVLDENGKLVSLLDAVPADQNFICPAYHSAVRLKNGKVMRPHFTHVSLDKCDFYSGNESSEHLQLKATFYHAVSRTEQVVTEKVLPDLHQVADLLVNDNLALKVQCPHLSEQRLSQRTRAYQSHGIQVLWLLGEKLRLGNRLSPLQRHFLCFSQNMGFHLWELDVTKQLIRLHYLVYENLHGKTHYLAKTCLFSDDIMAFFRLPYRQQKLSTYEINRDQTLLTYIQKQLSPRHSIWLKRQEEAYLQGKNLLSSPLSAYFPQVCPFDFAEGFCQISQDLSPFYENFHCFHQNQTEKERRWLYPPAYYDKMINKPQKGECDVR